MKKYLFLLVTLLLTIATYSWAEQTRDPGPDVGIKVSDGTIVQDIIPSIVVTDVDHWIAHQGAAYIVSDAITVGATDNYEFLFRNLTSDGTHLVHFTFTSTQGDAEITLYENSTVAFVGVTSLPHNANRNYADVSEVIVFTNTSTTAFGTQLEHDIITGGKQSGGSGGSTHEWVLAEDKNYVINYVNNSAQADTITFHLDFLELNLLP